MAALLLASIEWCAVADDRLITGLETGGGALKVRVRSARGAAGCVDVFTSTNLSTALWRMIGEEIATGDDPAGIEFPVSMGSGRCLFVAATEGGVGADEDPDADGISSGRERFLYGTDPFWADTDGDGLGDGDEVLRYGTSPTRGDTDGDSLPDGWEVAYGTDPTRTSVADATIDIGFVGQYIPSNASSRRVFVDTNNLAYVANEQYGVCIVDVSDPTTPTLAGEFITRDCAYDVMAAHGHVYVADGTNGLAIFTGTATYSMTANYVISGCASYGLDMQFPYAYAAIHYPGLDLGFAIVDISDALAPTLLQLSDTGYYNGHLVMDVNATTNAVFEVGSAGVFTHLLTGKTNAVFAGVGPLSAPPDEPLFNEETAAVAVMANTAYVAFGFEGLVTLDVEDLANVIYLGQIKEPYYRALDVSLANASLLFVASEYDTSYGQIEAFDVSNPSNPVSRFATNIDTIARGIYTRGPYIYVAADTGGLMIYENRSYDGDADGLPDGWEIFNFGGTTAQGTTNDFDHDGISNWGEYQAGTSPTNTDSDADGLLDGEEVGALTDPRDADTDDDGLADGLEVHTYGSKPLNDDTDGDGLVDGAEVHTHHSNPCSEDTDTDGLSDADEVHVYHTDPTKADSDGDSLSDAWEVRYGGDPTLTSLVPTTLDIVFRSQYTPSNASARRVFVDTNNIAYVANEQYGVFIVNVSNAASPTLAGEFGTGDHAYDVMAAHGHVYVADGTNGLAIYTATNLPAVETNGTYGLPSTYSMGLDLMFPYAYVTFDMNTFVVLDVTNPASPNSVGQGQYTGYLTSDVKAYSNRLFEVGPSYVTTHQLYDLTNAVLIGAGPTNDEGYALFPLEYTEAIAVCDNYAYVAFGSEGLIILDVEDLANVIYLDQVQENYNQALDVTLSGSSLLFVASQYDSFNGRIEAFDVSNPSNPMARFATNINSIAKGIYTRGPYIYVAADTNGLMILENRSYDGDADGLPDGWEIAQFGSLAAQGTTNDFDHDGINNWGEYTLGTSPTNTDSDADGLLDGEEIAHLADPRDPDTDDDGLADGEEINLYHTNPAAMDSDGDGLSDGAEVQTHHTNPAAADSDDDGASDAVELGLGTDPMAVSSYDRTISGRIAGVLPLRPVVVLASVTESGWASPFFTVVRGGTNFVINHVLRQTNLWLKAYWDVNDNGVRNDGEAGSVYVANPVRLTTGDLANVVITLSGVDSDGDGMPDDWEWLCLGTTGYGATGDKDSDGLSNLAEYTRGTHPNRADSDGDGYSDGDEVNRYGTDPTRDASYPMPVVGEFSYVGRQTGTFHFAAVTNAGSWTSVWSTVRLKPSAFSISAVPTDRTYWFKAFRDSNGNGNRDPWEAGGVASAEPVYVGASNAMAGVQYLEQAGMPEWTYAAGGTFLRRWTGGSHALAYTLPFAFPFAGAARTNCWIDEAGRVTFAATDGDQTATVDELKAVPAIAALWGGIDTRYGGIYHTARVDSVTIRWAGSYGGVFGAAANFSVTLYSNGLIRCAYGSGNTNGGVIGVSAGDGVHYCVSTRSGAGRSMDGAWDVIFKPGVSRRTWQHVGAIVLSDPDLDEDALPDWWEIATLDGTNSGSGSGDADGDGGSNLDEYLGQTDPTNNASKRVALSGVVAYSGMQTGIVRVVATATNGETLLCESSIAAPGAFSGLMVAAPGCYRVRGYRDGNGNGQWDYWEACGDAAGSPLTVTGGMSGLQITLSDPATDKDGDGLPDGWEHRWFGGILVTTGRADPDADGLANAAELTMGTLPGVADTDCDGWSDGIEVSAYGTDPCDVTAYPVSVGIAMVYTGSQAGVFHVAAGTNAADWAGAYGVISVETNATLVVRPGANLWFMAWLDSDADGVRGTWEPCGALAGNPFVASNGVVNRATIVCSDPDVDGDGLPDWWEILHFEGTNGNASADADGDGVSNGDEYANGLDPRDPTNRLASIAGSVTAGDGLTGVIRVLAVKSEDGWASARSAELAVPGAFVVAGVPVPKTYWIKAYRDVNGNGACDGWEPSVVCTQGAMSVTGSVAGVRLAIEAVDADRDGIPDAWEWQIVEAESGDAIASVGSVVGDADFDGDGVGNADEYRCGTSPTNALSQPVRVRFALAGTTVVAGVSAMLPVRVVLTEASASAVTVRVSCVGGSATPDVDYAFTDQSVLFAAMQTSVVVQVGIVSNAAGGPAEDVLLGVERVAGPVVAGSPATHRIVIASDTKDSDGDGLPDWWELLHFGGTTVADPAGNPDGDGWNNAEEYANQGNPTVGSVLDAGNVLQLNVATPIRR